ncbi:MAG: hypothetical protein ACE5RC_07405, partial [Nitrosopumilus sp.]
MQNPDWPDAPCYGCSGCFPGLEQKKLDWAPYYDYKGSVWMDAKKQQMDSAISNNSLREWFEQDDAHQNVHTYYFLHGDAPSVYGMNFEETLGFEKAWDAVENNSADAPMLLWNYHDIILDGAIIETDLAVTIRGDHVPLHHIKVNEYFKGGKNSDMVSAVENPDDLEFELFENGLFYLKKLENQNWYTVTIASVPTFGNCDARDMIEISPVLPNEDFPISAPAHPLGIDPCVPDYFDDDPDRIIADDVVSQDKSTPYNKNVFPRHGNPPGSFTPLQHERNGTPLNQMQCRNDDHVLIQKYDGSPACVIESTKQKLIERGWTDSADTNWKKYITVSATR